MMSHRNKKMLIWDLKELENFSHQSLPIESFNMWPSGNCGHVYASSHSQARRHISGWAMRNTNNHNINILKKSCLGVLICSKGCRKSDNNVVAVRPAICDKARKKQMGRKCPNGCGGVLIMQQCKGHSGYPVTHFWRHHRDKVFFLGKGQHDHPKPELKLGAEKRKTYVRNATTNRSSRSSEKLVNAATSIVERFANTCKYAGTGTQIQQTILGYNQLYNNQQQPAMLYNHHQSTSPYYSTTESIHVTPQRLVVPDCDVYIPNINQNILTSSKQNSVYQSQPYLEIPAYYPNMNGCSATPVPIDYSLNPDIFSSANGTQMESFTRNAFNDTGATSSILDLSIPTSLSLDNTWQSEPVESNSRYYTKNVAHYQTSTLTMSTTSKVFERGPIIPNTQMRSAQMYEQQAKEVPPRLRAIWESVCETDEPYGSSLALAMDDHQFEEPKAIAAVDLPLPLEERTKSEVSLKEMMDIDNLDMGDISNILSLPAGATKPRTMIDTLQSAPLPNLSSFLRGIDYL